MSIIKLLDRTAVAVFCAANEGGHKPGKPEILRDLSEHGKLREFSGNSVQPQGKIVTNKVFLVRHSNICEIAVDWVYRIVRISGSSDAAQ